MSDSKQVLVTLCIIQQGSKVLLGLKKRGRGEGHWNGFGGKLEAEESLEDAARREVKEEVGITVRDLEKAGVIDFKFEDQSWDIQVHIYKSIQFEGVPTESDEMKPEWFDAESLPYHAMWAADTHWFPYLLGGKKFRGHFLYDTPSTSERAGVILDQTIEEVESLKEGYE